MMMTPEGDQSTTTTSYSVKSSSSSSPSSSFADSDGSNDCRFKLNLPKVEGEVEKTIETVLRLIQRKNEEEEANFEAVFASTCDRTRQNRQTATLHPQSITLLRLLLLLLTTKISHTHTVSLWWK